MAQTSIGKYLIQQLQDHILKVMRSQPDCSASGIGLRNSELEYLCDLALHLEKQDSYLTYSILMSLIKDGRVEKIGEYRKPRYRLT